MNLLVMYFLVNNIECSNEILSHSVYVHSCIIFLRSFEVSKLIMDMETNQVLHTNEMSTISTNIGTTEKKMYTRIVVVLMRNSRLHSGGGTDGYVAKLAFTCVHVVVALPTNSKPELQE